MPEVLTPESRDAQSGVEELLAGVLAEHRLVAITGGTAAGAQWICRCGAQQINPGGRDHAEWMHARHAAHHLAAALGPVLAGERAEAWDEGYAQAEKDFVHSDYCGTRCQCDPNLTSGAGNPYRADREQP